MIVGSPKEVFKGEARVAMTPESAKQIQKLGYTCIFESTGCCHPFFPDSPGRILQRQILALILSP